MLIDDPQKRGAPTVDNEQPLKRRFSRGLATVIVTVCLLSSVAENMNAHGRSGRPGVVCGAARRLANGNGNV
ncbi:hypothetical protein J6590_004406 [Homalodisca vitripennis]|nr:hypothetical protein J6590_004406 [Homalodisca vitripennis]